MDLYTTTVPGFVRQLKALKAVLQKGEAFAQERKEFFHTDGQLEGILLHDRLIFDQFPLMKQVQIATDSVKIGVAKVAEVDAPVFEDTETTFVELYERIDKTVAFLETITPDMMTGKETLLIGSPYWGDKKMTADNYLIHHTIPNFYFHVTTAFAILRRNGVVIGKLDFFGEREFANV